MLHVTTEIGKAGFTERERKHFPTLTNTSSLPQYKPRGRRYIPHGYGDDYEFKPHPPHIDPEYSECGPDWKSRLRWIPSPHNKDYPAEENWPTPWKSLRTYPWLSGGGGGGGAEEWELFPDALGGTLRSTWGGVHKATEVSDPKLTHARLFARPRMVVDKRNGIPMAAPGDKSYQAVEYSPNFYKFGTTLPVVKFGGAVAFRPEAFVPFGDLPSAPRETFANKERRRRTQEDVDSVRCLDRWRPSTPLVAPPHPNQPGTAPLPELLGK